jgi:hypothetical protein
MHTTTDSGKKGMVVIETNTCPSGMKSTPLQDDLEEMGMLATCLAFWNGAYFDRPCWPSVRSRLAVFVGRAE